MVIFVCKYQIQIRQNKQGFVYKNRKRFVEQMEAGL